MKSIVYLILFVLFSGCDFKSADDYYKSATMNYNNHNYREAIYSYDKAIKKKTKFLRAYLNRGLCFEALNKIDSAILDYKTVLKIDSNNIEALYNIGICKSNQNLYNDAHYYFTKALNDKGFSDSSTSLILNMNKDFMWADKMESFDVPSYEIFFDRGFANYNLRKVKSAYLDFNRCIESNYNLGQSYYMVGLCWLAANNKPKACEALKQAVYNKDSMALDLWYKTCR